MDWPKPLKPTTGPLRQDKIDGAYEAMGQWGDATRKLQSRELVPPDMMCGLTLFLLGSQPRDTTRTPEIPGAGGGVAGGVWVRERYIIRRPLGRYEAFSVSGENVGRHVHKGRRYGTNVSLTMGPDGEDVGANITTGLLQYKVQEGLQDQVEGIAANHLKDFVPDRAAAASNPHVEQLRSLVAGEDLSGPRMQISLAMMQARETAQSDNPIHSDPEMAKRAGLSEPIAGGSHVLAFPLEAILHRCGPESLLYGSVFDIRWKSPVMADVPVTPKVVVVEASTAQVSLDVSMQRDDGVAAMTGQIQIPLPEANK
ncbi:MAG: MaoC family dehydratase [Pseudomonadota bacterium]